MSKKDQPKKLVSQRQSVHVVFFSCENCGEEIDYIQFCPDCGKPMRVIDVVEKFGEDADEFVKRIEDRLAQGIEESKEGYADTVVDEEPNVIVLGDEEHIDDGAVVDDVDSLEEIFPDEDGDVKKVAEDGSELSDLDDIVAELDKEDDDFTMDDLGDDGLPEL